MQLQVGVHEEPQGWAEEQFAGAKLTDIRRVARVKQIAEAMAVHPGRSIPRLCCSPYAVKATYNFFKHEELDFGHFMLSWQVDRARCSNPGHLIAHDHLARVT